MKRRIICALLCAALLLLPLPAYAAAIVPSPQAFFADGAAVDCEKYNIDGCNYFKLRDLAMLLSGTAAAFAVDYDAGRNAAVITTGQAYAPIGGELTPGEDRSASAVPSPQAVIVDGVERRDLTVWNIGGYNFFQLRELGALLGFGVDYDKAANAALIDTGGPVEPETPEEPDEPETPDTPQALAFAALRDWVQRGYNTLTADEGWPVYWRAAPFDGGAWRRSGVRYELDSGALRLVHHALLPNGGEYYATLTLAPAGEEFAADLTYYSSDLLTAVPFYGAARLDAAALTGDALPEFDSVQGWPEDTSEKPRMARLLRGAALEMLALADALLTEEVAPGGGMSVADFGFDPAAVSDAAAARGASTPAAPLRLYSNDGAVYLGLAVYGADDSIWNEHGLYGAPDSPLSIMNPTGRYGSETGDESAFNPYATHPPMLRDAEGGFLCYVSDNPGLTGAYRLREILVYLIESGLYRGGV